MNKASRAFISTSSKLAAGGFILILAGGMILQPQVVFAMAVAYLLSLLFVGSNLFVIPKIDLEDHQKFNRIFFISLVLRFVLVLASIVFVLKVLKIHQIYFTVSFIISYIFHSVIEIIFINKILETDN